MLTMQGKLKREYEIMARITSELSNRSKEEIWANMIEVATSPINKTSIMYKANLSYAQLQIYLGLLKDRQLLMKTDEEQWVATEKGRQFVNTYNTIRSILGKQQGSLHIGENGE